MVTKKGFSLTSILIVVAVIAATGAVWYLRPWQIGQEGGNGFTACTQDAMQCHDGSYVSRTGPNCEFAPCPTLEVGQDDGKTEQTDMADTTGWKTYRNEEYGFEFRYPESFEISNEAKNFGNFHGSEFSLSLSSTKSIHGLPIAIFDVSVDILDNPQRKSPQDWYSNYYQEQEKLAKAEGGPFHLVVPNDWIPSMLNGVPVLQLKQTGYPIAKPYDKPAMTIFTQGSTAYLFGQNNDVSPHNVDKDAEETFYSINKTILESFKFTK